MAWYVIVEIDPKTKDERVITDPDNHWPSLKIKKHEYERQSPDKKYQIVKTSY